MAKGTIFDVERLKEELNSETFLSGLEQVINVALKTGREVGFRAYYSKEADILVYPDYITLGEEKKIEFLPDFDLPSDAPPILKVEESLRMARREHDRLNYPQNEDYKIRRKRGFLDRDKSSLICVHTHYHPDDDPDGIMTPSESDLKSLNATRSLFVPSSEVKSYKLRNPISIIVVPTSGFHPLYIFQENSETLLPEDTNFGQLKDRLCEANMFRIHFGPNLPAVKEYNVLIAEANPDCRQIELKGQYRLMPLVR